MDRERQKREQEQPTLWQEVEGEAQSTCPQGTELNRATTETESPAENRNLMEVMAQQENLNMALWQVKKNKGAPGIDGMRVEQLEEHFEKEWPNIREELRQGTYQPQPVRRVEIPKPNGGKRKLGIPTAVDRVIQQMVLRVMEPIWEPTFSDSSYGFRPGISAHQAVEDVQNYITRGRTWVVNMDMDKFFDRVNHDKLMGIIAKRITDKRILKLIRSFLNAGVMENGVVVRNYMGTPQGGPLSPLLSNIYLDKLDKELEKRGHKFVRYADDVNILVGSERAAIRVMGSITAFITKKLKLKVNTEKSKVEPYWENTFLGFGFIKEEEPRRTISHKSITRFKKRIREICNRNRGISAQMMFIQLKRYMLGWRAYYGFTQTTWQLENLEGWIRRKLRCVAWVQWKTGRNRYKQLRKRGVPEHYARITAWSSKGPWRISRSWSLHQAFPNKLFKAWGLPPLVPV